MAAGLRLEIAGRLVNEPRLPAARSRVAPVHFEQHRRPVLRILAADAGEDRERRVLFVVGIRKELLDLERPKFSAQGIETVLVRRFCDELKTGRKIIVALQKVLELAVFLRFRLGCSGVFPEVRVAYFELQLFLPDALFFLVKATRLSGGHPLAVL